MVDRMVNRVNMRLLPRARLSRACRQWYVLGRWHARGSLGSHRGRCSSSFVQSVVRWVGWLVVWLVVWLVGQFVGRFDLGLGLVRSG